MEAVALAATTYAPEQETDATPLIVAHGLFGSGRNWASLARRFANDPRRPRKVVTVDMRNHGQSPWAPAMDYEAMGRDLRAAIQAHGDGRALLIGHSMGGKASMAAALQDPEAVAGLVVADMAPVPYDDHGHGPIVAAMRGLDLSKVSRRAEADAPMADAIPDPSLRAFILQNLVVSEGVASWRLNLSVLSDSLPKLMDWPKALRALTYAGEVLFYHGGASDFLTDDARPEIARQFPNAEIDAMDGAGHWLHAERPDAFFERVSGWLVERP